MEGEYDKDEINPAFDAESRRELAENVIGEVDWYDDLHGYCACPGEDQHRKPTRPNHCRIYIDRVPTISCFHTSCQAAVEVKNRLLRSKLPTLNDGDDSGDRQIVRRISRCEKIKRKGVTALEQICSEYAWPDEGIATAIARSSPITLPTDPVEQTNLFLRTLFELSDVVWIGQKYHSKYPRYRCHFRSVEEWLRSNLRAGEFTCPSTFVPGGYCRRDDAIVQRRYVVVESDSLTWGETAGVFEYLEKVLDWRLRAVVYSGSRSLHGWFEGTLLSWPIDELAAFVRGLGCDDATVRPSQPVRLPGALRADPRNYQALLYLSPSEPR